MNAAASTDGDAYQCTDGDAYSAAAYPHACAHDCACDGDAYATSAGGAFGRHRGAGRFLL